MKKQTKSSVVAFKVEEELADFLDKLPNKSDFIRRAIYAQLGVACPVCQGTGSVSRETHDAFTVFLEKWEVHSCESCGDQYPMLKDLSEVTGNLCKHLQENWLNNSPKLCFTCSHTDR